MCLSPIRVTHPFWRAHKNGDQRTPYGPDGQLRLSGLSSYEAHGGYIIVPCGKCVDCLKKKARDWRVRLALEHMYGCKKGAIFVTLTFSDRYIKFAERRVGRLIRLFYDRYRKKYGQSLRFWLITENGQDDRYTHRLHLHGVFFDPAFYLSNNVHKSFTKMNKILRKLWKYGNTFVGYFSLKTANYCLKYLLKSFQFPEFHPEIFCSNGIGLAYAETSQGLEVLAKWHRACMDASRRLPAPRVQLGDYLYSIPGYILASVFTDPWDRLFLSIASRENPDCSPPRVAGQSCFDARIYYARLDGRKRLLQDASLPIGPIPRVTILDSDPIFLLNSDEITMYSEWQQLQTP